VINFGVLRILDSSPTHGDTKFAEEKMKSLFPGCELSQEDNDEEYVRRSSNLFQRERLRRINIRYDVVEYAHLLKYVLQQISQRTILTLTSNFRLIFFLTSNKYLDIDVSRGSLLSPPGLL
jgi:hypothetical protein